MDGSLFNTGEELNFAVKEGEFALKCLVLCDAGLMLSGE